MALQIPVMLIFEISKGTEFNVISFISFIYLFKNSTHP